MKAYNKGDKVTYITSWDDRGTFAYTHAIVHSCGAKRMVLTNEKSGREMGRCFTPARLESIDGLAAAGFRGTFPRLDDAQAQALCIAAGNLFVPQLRAQYERKIALANSASYADGIREYIEQLHEARATWTAEV